MTIDPTARIEDGAVIGVGTSIGPYCLVGSHVSIGPDCRLVSHIHITGQTTIGAGCTIYPLVSLGTPPQSLSHHGELTRLEIGQGCTIREQVTMNAGTVAGGGITHLCRTFVRDEVSGWRRSRDRGNPGLHRCRQASCAVSAEEERLLLRPSAAPMPEQ
jgi:acetyltransferase-like isoleucine patch superfamily enzyme